MRGLLYKEFAVNKMNLLFYGIAVILMGSLVFFPYIISDSAADTELTKMFAGILGILMYVVDFYLLNLFNVNFIQSDEQKNCAYFAVTTPESVEGVVWTKYVFILLNGIFLVVWCHFIGAFMALFTDAMMDAQLFYVMLFFAHLFFSAIDLPFIFRFGAKAGSAYKGVLFLVVLLGGFIYALFGDLSIFGSRDAFYDAVCGFITGENIPDSFWLWLGLFPFISMGLYYASYKLSCKLYLKGVDTYAK